MRRFDFDARSGVTIDGWKGVAVNQVEVDVLLWRTATASQGGNCVQVATAYESIAVRNSREPHGPVLLFTRAEWSAFVDGVRRGEFDEFAES
jgi:hypothetical protein